MNFYKHKIMASSLSIYDDILNIHPDLFIPTSILQQILREEMIGLSLAGLPLRTRSKVVKTKICEVLGYPIPKSFKKTHPRFLGQNFDIYIQKSMNVQIWNENIEPNRRYVFFKVNANDIITNIKVITGEQLAKYDTTGTLTKKYQATMVSRNQSMLLSPKDTPTISSFIIDNQQIELTSIEPNAKPNSDHLLRIAALYQKLLPMVGQKIEYIDAVQERNRGAKIHSIICRLLGYATFADDGTYPDLLNQLLEVKLQTSPTIDLGLHSPDDDKNIVSIGNTHFTSHDIRYAIIDGTRHEKHIEINHLYLVNGKDFTKYFPLFKGKVQNTKIQMLLPPTFFDD